MIRGPPSSDGASPLSSASSGTKTTGFRRNDRIQRLPRDGGAQIAAIERELALECEGAVVRIRHRLGKLAVGDASVAIVAVSPHRREALAACREGIERVKARVPIWKREQGPGRDPVWVDPRHEHAPEGAPRRR